MYDFILGSVLALECSVLLWSRILQESLWFVENTLSTVGLASACCTWASFWFAPFLLEMHDSWVSVSSKEPFVGRPRLPPLSAAPQSFSLPVSEGLHQRATFLTNQPRSLLKNLLRKVGRQCAELFLEGASFVRLVAEKQAVSRFSGAEKPLPARVWKSRTCGTLCTLHRGSLNCTNLRRINTTLCVSNARLDSRSFSADLWPVSTKRSDFSFYLHENYFRESRLFWFILLPLNSRWWSSKGSWTIPLVTPILIYLCTYVLTYSCTCMCTCRTEWTKQWLFLTFS